MPDETLTSYMRRVAAFHAGIGVFEFLGALDLSRLEIIDPSCDTLDRSARLIGQSNEVLHRMVIRSIHQRIPAVGDEHFHTEFVNLKQTSFCPACLLEDADLRSP